jgi:ATPase associated with various cellular activities AAA_5
MSRLSEFKEFYLRVVLPNKQSYRNYFNKANFDENIKELIARYQTSYGFNPFEENVSLENLDIKTIDNTFEDYSNSKGNGVPKAIINTHYRKFLEYEENVYFENLQELIDKIHEEFEEDNFIEKFQKTRIQLNGNSRVASKMALFAGATDPKNDDWTFNIGSTKELQYHLLYRLEGQLHYGLKFSAYPEWRANPYPLEEVQPFINSYFNHKQEIRELLNDYSLFFDDRDTDIRPTDEDSLRNIEIKQGILLGKVLKVEEDTDGDTYIKGSSFLELIYDLQGKQFEVYKLIFSNANLIKENKMNIENEIQKYTDLLHYKPQIILQGPPGTGKTREARRIAKALLGLGENDSLEGNEQFKLIQFHPSYSYEDFVRGIVAKPNEEGDGIVYTAENKVLAEFAKEALNNWSKTQQNTQAQKEQGVFEAFIEHIKEELAQNEDYKYPLTESVYIFDADDKRFKYKGDNWEAHRKGLNMNYIDIKRIIESGIKDRQGITKLTNIGGLARQHASYFLRIIEKYYEFRKNYNPIIDKIPLKSFVLIIDEINRANLSAVLGELIYALEYRGEAVQSMYVIEGENNLILPPNLYIIGTMNTADRSVGHIDYAIRRRFAFVNVLPKDLTSELGDQFDSVLFAKVTDLFNTNLSPEFKKEDVQLGHSYFITKNTPIDIRWEYEIKPILLEYIKDGILIGQDIEEKINSLITV